MANEVVLNALLWDILKENGILESQAEERNADKSKTDIRCTVGDYIVAVEAEHGTTATKKDRLLRMLITNLTAKSAMWLLRWFIRPSATHATTCSIASCWSTCGHPTTSPNPDLPSGLR